MAAASTLCFSFSSLLMAGRKSTSVSLDDLKALADEMAALARARVPLEQGLSSLGREYPGGLGKLTSLLAERLRQGEPLPQALEALGDRTPPLFKAVVTAGLQGGDLPAALDGFSSLALRLAELRRTVRLAMIYPYSLLLLAYALFLGFVVAVAPRFAAAQQAIEHPAELETRVVSRTSAFLHDYVWYWAPPLLLVLLLIALWPRRRADFAAVPRGGPLWLLALPWLRPLDRYGRWAIFADVLASLLQRELPLDEALRLAAQAAGDKQITNAATELARREESPAKHGPSSTAPPGAPAALWWLLSCRTAHPDRISHQAWLSALHRLAKRYGRRAAEIADAARVAVPLLFTVLIGGTVALLYALAMMLPWLQLYRDLG